MAAVLLEIYVAGDGAACCTGNAIVLVLVLARVLVCVRVMVRIRVLVVRRVTPSPWHANGGWRVNPELWRWLTYTYVAPSSTGGRVLLRRSSVQGPSSFLSKS